MGLDCNRQYLFTMDRFVQKWRVDSQKSQTIQKEKTPLKDHPSNVAEIRQRKAFSFNPLRSIIHSGFLFSNSVAPELQTSGLIPNKENCNQVSNKSKDSNSTNVSNSSSTRPDKKKQSARTYQAHWLQTFGWIKYEDASDKVFCSVCIEAYTKLKINIILESFDKYAYNCYVVEGFSQWRNAITRFKAHETTQCHRKAVAAIASKNQGVNVLHSISKQSAEARISARFCLMKIVESIRFLATQGIPIRGHSEKKSNFIQLLKLRSQDIPLLKSWMERSSYKWISHEIIEEILFLLSLTLQRKLLEKIVSPPFYALMADETTDMSHKEQMSVNFRVVDECLNIHEYFLGFYETPFTNAETLFKVLRDVLRRFNLPFCRCRGQCYDGASCVSGYITGLQTRVRKEEPRAYYTHCAGRNLNLVAQDGMKMINVIASFLSEMKELVTFIRASAKRFEIFKQIQSEIDDDDDDDEDDAIEEEGCVHKSTNLRSFCWTRWCVRVKSLKSIRANYKEIIQFCDKIGKET